MKLKPLADRVIVKQVEAEEKIERGFNRVYAERATLDLFWRRQQRVPVEQWGEKTAAAFLGVRLECAQCHKHPFDRWTRPTTAPTPTSSASSATTPRRKPASWCRS